MPRDPLSEIADPRAATASYAGQQWFGHPRGLATLFFTEMWERFSYYGMRALLILFMTAAVTADNPGLGFEVDKAAAIYGLYTAMVYLLALPGGWVADNLWGLRKAVFVGGCIIAAGHFSMAIPTVETFYLGLMLITIGTGLLKPNISAIVGDLYPEGGARRDAGYSVYYMGINLGGFLGPLLCGYFGEGLNWHLGFSLAGIGMVAGLIQYRRGLRHLGDAGKLDLGDPDLVVRKSRNFYIAMAAVGAAIILAVLLVRSGALAIPLTTVARSLGVVIVGVTLLYFIYLMVAGGHTSMEKRRLGVILWLFILAALFWSGFEQAGSSLNLFAERLTDRVMLGWEMPASWLQSVNSFFIILLAPVFGSVWVWLANRRANPSIPVKFGLGLLGLAMGFFVIAWGAANATPENGASPAWLVVMYFLHTCGELALSPVGLSSMTKLAPRSRVGQMMGVWFVASALGNLIAGLVAGTLGGMEPSDLFRTVAMITGGVGLFALVVSPAIRRLMGDVE
ncbi:MAG TPA: peptide MFS transporter [Gemmatimonadota bacterium]|nr:peptide MFS transporter [Gemmatimonadota bacterium]